MSGKTQAPAPRAVIGACPARGHRRLSCPRNAAGAPPVVRPSKPEVHMRHSALFGVTAAALAVIALPAAAKPAPQFLHEAMQGDNSEIALGRMAENRAVRPQVREFGRMLQQDHSQARDQVLALAGRMGVRPTDEMAPAARQEQRKLRRLSGPAFDREFVRYMVGDHRKDIRDFQEQSRGRGPAAQLARDTLPTLRKHLDMAMRLQR
jgi:putative membrane protein